MSSSSKHRSVRALTICLIAFASCLFAGMLVAAENNKPEKADPFAVPDGTPAELYAYIEGLNKVMPERRDRESIIAFIKKLGKARTEACEKILASAAPLEEKKKAAEMLFSTTAQMALRLGDPQAAKTLAELPARFEKMNMPKLAKAAKPAVVQSNLMMALKGMPGALPLDEVLKGLKQLVEKAPGMGSLRMVLSTVSFMSQAGKTAEAADLCKWSVKVFGKSKDPEVLARLETVKGIGRRLQLPGKTMVVKGPLLDSKPYNLSKEKGKVVLVQYWATWCKPCLEEIVNVLKNYKLYHDRGFEVIGISIDSDKETLEKFLDREKLPWPVMLDSEAKQSNAARYGVMGVPLLILVDQQGKVVSLNARGPNLGKELDKLLGPPNTKAQARAF